MNEYIRKAKEEAQLGVNSHEGGPFGAVIVDKAGNIVGKGHNQVLKNSDPTAHAEIQAIRNACKNMGTHNLEECTIYISCEPCPMCLSAIIWANIKNVYYACDRKDAAEIGFRDDAIYEYFSGNNKQILKIKQINREECLDIMQQYKENSGTIY